MAAAAVGPHAGEVRTSRHAQSGLLHLARTLKDLGGIPAYGNQRTAWDAGCRRDYENPGHR